MAETLTRDSNRCPTHPGAFLREIVLPGIDAPKTRIAESLGISRQTLYDIINEKQPVTPEMAIRLAAYLGGSDQSWLNMQSAYDLWHARRRVDTKKIMKVERTPIGGVFEDMTDVVSGKDPSSPREVKGRIANTEVTIRGKDGRIRSKSGKLARRRSPSGKKSA